MPKIQGSTEYTRSTELDTGVFASKQTISKIANSSNHPSQEEKLTIGQKGYKPELCLIVTFTDESGRDMQKYLFGKYLKDKITGNIKGWVTQGNAVLSFLYACLGKDNVNVNDDYSISEQLLNRCVGKEIWKVDYVTREYSQNGEIKPGYQLLNAFFPSSTKESQLIEYWQDRKTSLRDYQPQIYRNYIKRKDEGDTSFKYGANTEVEEESSEDSVI